MASSNARSKLNCHIHQLYVRQDFDECLKLIDGLLKDSSAHHEFAFYTKALILRQRGQIQESLALFQQAAALSPQSIANLKQVGRSLYLLGKHKAALEVYEEAQRLQEDDWEIWHNKGVSRFVHGITPKL